MTDTRATYVQNETHAEKSLESRLIWVTVNVSVLDLVVWMIAHNGLLSYTLPARPQ